MTVQDVPTLRQRLTAARRTAFATSRTLVDLASAPPGGVDQRTAVELGYAAEAAEELERRLSRLARRLNR